MLLRCLAASICLLSWLLGIFLAPALLLSCFIGDLGYQNIDILMSLGKQVYGFYIVNNVCYGDIWTYCCLGTKIVYFGGRCQTGENLPAIAESLAREGILISWHLGATCLASWGMLPGTMMHDS